MTGAKQPDHEKNMVRATTARWVERNEEIRAEAEDIVTNSNAISRLHEIRARWSPDALQVLQSIHPAAADDIAWLSEAFGLSIQLHLETLAVSNDITDLLSRIARANGDAATYAATILAADIDAKAAAEPVGDDS